jgi:hypothetical protein
MAMMDRLSGSVPQIQDSPKCRNMENQLDRKRAKAKRLRRQERPEGEQVFIRFTSFIGFLWGVNAAYPSSLAPQPVAPEPVIWPCV